MSNEVQRTIVKDRSRAIDKTITILKATRKVISAMIPEVIVIAIAKSRGLLKAMKKIVVSIVNAVAMTYSKIAIFRTKLTTTIVMRLVMMSSKSMIMTRQTTISFFKSGWSMICPVSISMNMSNYMFFSFRPVSYQKLCSSSSKTNIWLFSF